MFFHGVCNAICISLEVCVDVPRTNVIVCIPDIYIIFIYSHTRHVSADMYIHFLYTAVGYG